MNDYKNFYEYTYRPGNGVKSTLLKVALISLYTVFTLVYLVIFGLLFRAVALLVLFPFLLFAIIKFSYKYTDREYEISVEAGEMTVAVIYGSVRRRTKKQVSLPEATLIAKYTESRKAMVNGGSIAEVANFVGDEGSEDNFIIVYPDSRRGKKNAILIETDEELRRVLRICNPSAFERN